MAQPGPTFQCIVVAPSGKLLDCQASSAVFPSHDGQVGILAGHMPMFCLLGLGIMEVKYPSPGRPASEPTYLLVDGGFAVVCQDVLKVVSYEVVAPSIMRQGIVDLSLAAIDKALYASGTGLEEKTHLARKRSLLTRLAQLHGDPKA